MDNTPNCLFCNSSEMQPSVYEDTVFNGKTFQYPQCKVCKLVFIHPLPGADDLEKMYPVDYQTEHYGSVKTKADGLYDFLFSEIKKYSKGNSIVDYGCGYGRFVVEALEQGYEVTGTEFNPELVSTLKQALPNANFETIDAFLESPTKYDIIFMSNVLEHLTNPLEVTQKLKAKLNDEGLLVLEGPIEDNFTLALAFRKLIFGLRKKLFKKQASHIPWHIFYANAKNQKGFIESMGFQTLYYQIDESPWPFPDKWANATSLSQKVMYLIGQASTQFGKRIKSVGNTFVYIGRIKIS